MKRVIRMSVELPDIEATENDIEEFIAFQLNAGCKISCDNPFLGDEITVNDYCIEDNN